MKTILAIETTSRILSVALGTRDGKVKELHSQVPLRHSENLIPLIDRLLKKEKLRLDDIGAFAIDRGPGSFTGLRIGFSLLKGFLAVRKKPCYGALSLDMMAENVRPRTPVQLGVLLDARRRAVYSRFYQYREGKWRAEGKLELLSLPELKVQVREGTHLVTDAEEASLPNAATLVRWFQSRDERLTPLKIPQELVPLYFRRSEAEEKKSL